VALLLGVLWPLLPTEPGKLRITSAKKALSVIRGIIAVREGLRAMMNTSNKV